MEIHIILNGHLSTPQWLVDAWQWFTALPWGIPGRFVLAVAACTVSWYVVCSAMDACIGWFSHSVA